MSDQLFANLRLCAASLVTLSGAGRVASLWFRDLNEEAVAALLLGAVYLITGLGLFGQSRFTLFVAITLCTAVAVYTLSNMTLLMPLQQAGLAVDIIIVLLCAMVIWHVRNRPSN